MSTGHTVEYYFDFSSPYAYLGSTQVDALAERTGATLVWRPMLLGGVFKLIGQASVPLETFSEAKQRHTFEDLKRWAAHWKVPFEFPSLFPMNTIKALRVYLSLSDARRDAYRKAVFEAYWARGEDIGDDQALAKYIGADAAEILARTQAPEIKKGLIDATQRAVDAGVFGAPTWVVDGKHLFWGQDKTALVEDCLRAGS